MANRTGLTRISGYATLYEHPDFPGLVIRPMVSLAAALTVGGVCVIDDNGSVILINHPDKKKLRKASLSLHQLRAHVSLPPIGHDVSNGAASQVIDSTAAYLPAAADVTVLPAGDEVHSYGRFNSGTIRAFALVGGGVTLAWKYAGTPGDAFQVNGITTTTFAKVGTFPADVQQAKPVYFRYQYIDVPFTKDLPATVAQFGPAFAEQNSSIAGKYEETYRAEAARLPKGSAPVRVFVTATSADPATIRVGGYASVVSPSGPGSRGPVAGYTTTSATTVVPLTGENVRKGTPMANKAIPIVSSGGLFNPARVRHWGGYSLSEAPKVATFGQAAIPLRALVGDLCPGLDFTSWSGSKPLIAEIPASTGAAGEQIGQAAYVPGEDDVSVEVIGYLDVLTAALDTAAATEAKLMGAPYRGRMSPVAARYGLLTAVTCLGSDVVVRESRNLYISNGGDVTASDKFQQGTLYVGKGGKLYSRDVVFASAITYASGVLKIDGVITPVAPTSVDGYVLGVGMTKVDDGELAALIGSRMAFLHRGTLTSTL